MSTPTIDQFTAAAAGYVLVPVGLILPTFLI
jgi:hypothetical protein